MDAIRLIESGERLQVAVNPREIEQAFAALWESAREDPDAPLATRASATNLVVATPEAAASETEAVLVDVTARLPGRVVLLVLGAPDEAASMTAWLSALCRLGGSGREHVCCELITIKATGRAIDALPTAVTPLLLGDLPATLWWRDDPAASPALMAELAGLCGRILVDLSRSEEAGAAPLVRLRDLAAGGIDAGDVLWTRLAPWRRAFARFFDPVPARGMLDRIRSVRFHVRNRCGTMSAWLLTAWLAERLGWTARSATGGRGEFADRAGGAIRFVVEEAAPAAECMHGIETWIVEAEEADGNSVGFTLVSKGDGAQVEAMLATEGACPLPSVLEVDDPGEAAAVTMALENMGPDCGLARAAGVLVLPRGTGPERGMTVEILDITVPLRPGMVVYPGDAGFRIDPHGTIEGGKGSNTSIITMGSHTGTHVDAPFHMIAGAPGIDRLPLENLVGACRVVDLQAADSIGVEELAALPLDGVERVLFKTRNSSRWGEAEFRRDFVALTGDGGAWLADRGMRLVGVDYLSVDRFRSGAHPAHHALMNAGITIVEGLNLSKAPPGDYTVVVAPMLIEKGDGAPARVYLLRPPMGL